MLTRSATKKQAGTPVASVRNREETNTPHDNLSESYQVKIQSCNSPNCTGENVSLPNIHLSFNVVPPKIGGENSTSNIVLNFDGMVINLPHNGVSNETKPNCKTNLKCSCSSRSYTKNKCSRKKRRDSNNEDYKEPSYVKFLPGLTSSVRKRTRSHTAQERQSGNEASTDIEEELNKSSISPIRKMRKEESSTDDETEKNEKCLFYNGVKVNGGYNPDDLKKQPVVKIVRLTEKAVNFWTTSYDSSCDSESDVTDSSSETQSSPNDKAVRRARLLRELKLVNQFVAERDSKHLNNVSSNGNDSRKRLFNEDRETCNISSQNGVVKQVDMVFGEIVSRGGSTETDEGFDEDGKEKFRKLISDQDSVETEIFDDSENEGWIELPPIEDIPCVVGEIIERLSSPTQDIVENGAETKETILRKNGDWYEIYTDAEEEQAARRVKTNKLGEESQAHEESKSCDLNRNVRGNRSKKTRKVGVKTVVGEEGVQSGVKDSREIVDMDILQIQLECINKELKLRSAESSKKQSKTSRKSEVDKKTSESDVTDSARKTRRSRRVDVMDEVSDSRRTPVRRNTPRKQSTDEAEQALERDATPRSTRVKQLRKQSTDMSDWKRRKMEEITTTPKRRTSHAEETEGEKDEVFTPRKSRAAKKTPKGIERNESVDGRASSVTSKSLKTSQMDTVEEVNEREDEVVSTPKSRRSKSPMKTQAEEKGPTKDTELDETAIAAVSSPLKKKKEAAERLRAEEEKEQSRRREREKAVTSSPRKGKSPVSVPDTPKLKKTPSPKKSEEVSPHIETDVVSSPKQKKAKSPKKQDEEEGLTLEREMSSPKQQKSKSPKKKHLDFREQEESESEDVVMCMVSSPKLKKSHSPNKKDTEVQKTEAIESEDVVMCVRSSPKQQSPKKKHAEMQGKEASPSEDVDVHVVSSPKLQKSQSPQKKHAEIQEKEARESEDGMYVVSSPKLLKSQTPKKKHAEVQETKANESEDIRVCMVSSPKQQRSSPMKKNVEIQKTETRESEGVGVCVTSSPKIQKSQTPKKKNAEIQETEARESEDVDVHVTSSPKQQKSQSPKKKHPEVQKPEVSESDDCLVDKTPRKDKKTESPEKRDVEEFATEDNDVEMSSPKRRKKQYEEEDESEESELEELMCVVSSRKQKKSRSIREEDVEVFFVGDSDSDDVDGMSISSPVQKKDTTTGKDRLDEESESEIADMLDISSPQLVKNKTSKKKRSEVRQQETRESDDAEECDTSSPKLFRKMKNHSGLEESDGSVKANVVISPKMKKKKFVAEKGNGEITEEMELELGDAEELLSKSKLSKKSKSSKKDKTRNVQDNAESSIPKLADDFLASIPSKKTDIKVKGHVETKTNTKKERTREMKTKIRVVENEDYIPLNVDGPTRFAVVGLDKFKTTTPKHPAFDLKTSLLYGSRIKRIPYSQCQAYNMKLESRKMRF